MSPFELPDHSISSRLRVTDSHSTMTPPPGPKGVSVVICTHNGSRTLTLALQALAAQTIEVDKLELIVVDDASTDGSGDLARAAGAHVVRREKSSGLAAARNAGIHVATGEIVAFTDDDCEPDPNWLEELLKPFADPSVDGVTGLTVTGSEDSVVFRFLALRNPLRPLPVAIVTNRDPLGRLRNYLRTETGPTLPLKARARVYALVGANMAIRKPLLDQLNGFDAGFVQSEDEDLSRRAHGLKSGAANFVYYPAALVRHHYRPGLKDTLRRAKIYGEGNAHTAVDAGLTPAVYPFPVIVVASLAFSLAFRPRMSFLSLLVPLGLYWRWTRLVPSRRSAEPLLYPYIQLLQEVWTMYGEARYLGSR